MIKTERYQFNLVEKEDKFSPDPLNENVQRVEAELAALDAAEAAEAAARAAETAALDQRVTALEVKKVMTGTYTGTDAGKQTINLGFAPIAVIVQGSETDNAVAIRGHAGGGAIVEENGFSAVENGMIHLNHSPRVYRFIAFG